MSELLKKTVDGNLCHGCGGCAAIAPVGSIAMTMTETGFLRPKPLRPLSKDFDRRFSQICSGRRIVRNSRTSNYHVSWGPLISAEVGYAVDDDVRFRGSSGGMLTAILIHLLENKIVDSVIQTKADPKDPVGNITVVSSNRDDILASIGSRYAPSSPLSDLEKHLVTGRRFAFVGKPCDIATLRAMALKDPRIDLQIPYMLSFFCAGIPSRNGAKDLLAEMGVTVEDVHAFAYRSSGWPGLARATKKDGTQVTMDYASSWGGVLSRNLQFRCKICPDGVGEFADISAADAWFGRGGYPDFAERDGRSLAVARTALGRKLLDAMVENNEICLEPVRIGEIASMQPYQLQRKRAILARLMALRVRGRESPHFKGLKLVRNAAMASPIWILRNFFGTYRRLSSLSPGKG
jgi:coenzyme F420 hydrogenase subunit beta